MRYRDDDIVYDTDGEEVDLPSELTLELDDEAAPSLELADAISNETGWMVKEFRHEIVSSPRPGAR